MKICYNAPAMIANNALNRNDDKLSQSLQRLSSGLKVVDAKNNPAGMAMGKRMNAQIVGISVASQNNSDAISVIETADGALSEIHEITQRMNELAVRASNGIMTNEDSVAANAEIMQLKEEITRIAKDTEFNGQSLLDSSFDLKGYTNEADLRTGYIGKGTTAGTYVSDITITYDADGNVTGATMPPVTTPPLGNPGFPDDAKISEISKGIIKITSEKNPNFEIDLKCSSPGPGTITYTGVEITVSGYGGMTMQIGSNENQTLDVRIPSISLEDMGIADIDLSTPALAQKSLDSIKQSVSYISSARSELGAFQNRLESNINSLDVSGENMTSAYSRIMDVDMAEEMTSYTTSQVVSQASMSMLAQANERPSQILQLLQ